MKTCMICGDEIPLGALFEEINGQPVDMDCWHLFFAADDQPQAEPTTEAEGGAA